VARDAAGGVGGAGEDASESMMCGSLLSKPRFYLGMAGVCAALAVWNVARVSTSTAWVLDAMQAVSSTLAGLFFSWRYWTLRQQRRDRE
jgi:hypothetical protein